MQSRIHISYAPLSPIRVISVDMIEFVLKIEVFEMKAVFVCEIKEVCSISVSWSRMRYFRLIEEMEMPKSIL